MPELTTTRRAEYEYDQNDNDVFGVVTLRFNQDSGETDADNQTIFVPVQLQDGNADVLNLTKEAAVRMAKDILLEAGETLQDWETPSWTGCIA